MHSSYSEHERCKIGAFKYVNWCWFRGATAAVIFHFCWSWDAYSAFKLQLWLLACFPCYWYSRLICSVQYVRNYGGHNFLCISGIATKMSHVDYVDRTWKYGTRRKRKSRTQEIYSKSASAQGRMCLSHVAWVFLTYINQRRVSLKQLLSLAGSIALTC